VAILISRVALEALKKSLEKIGFFHHHLLEIHLIDVSWTARLPPELAERL
jgi:hypothetical protein